MRHQNKKTIMTNDAKLNRATVRATSLAPAIRNLREKQKCPFQCCEVRGDGSVN